VAKKLENKQASAFFSKKYLFLFFSFLFFLF
jgi:hypothetical protein